MDYFNTRIETPDLQRLLGDSHTTSKEVNVKDIDGVSAVYATSEDVMTVCAIIGETVYDVEGGISEVGLAAEVMKDRVPVLVEHRDGTYTAISHHEYVEAFRAMEIGTFEAEVIPQAYFTEMRRVDKEAEGFRGSPENWDAVMRATGARGSIVIPSRDEKGRTYELTACFEFYGRAYELHADIKYEDILILPMNLAADKATGPQKMEDHQRMALALDTAKLKGTLIDRIVNSLSQ
ncbi:hypothetical protein HN419_04065 [Candidatus Woesearchaeota archaeon]|jgi:hypothetical protein|nr:hypothetical protein [Candidatus Woesearchaeota archaeon]MBT3537946.1 hypothetical protein [Candidatus Woesearchaeota archaeon]MBT4698084.1 hypothetical protein [Candidatus Woesearchaeota archaeon]MBT4717192.1 hypothetical protein [Candidatus Woesearchaeota archaeon]MBT7105615.1 hypothetical protein [Candidatus Woesearchaeota archaeon]